MMLFNVCTLYLLLKLAICRSHVLNYDSVTICDGMEKVVRCPNNENIHVLQGFYGKWKNHDCQGVKIDPKNSHTCSKDRKETTKVVRDSCQGQNQCTFIADKSIYGNPCPTNNPYLYVTFFCMEPGKKIEHQKDKNNQEVVTVTTHGYLVSEKKHVPTVLQDLKTSELNKENKNVEKTEKQFIKNSDEKTTRLESNMILPNIEKAMAVVTDLNMKPSKKDQAATPEQDEVKPETNLPAVEEETVGNAVRREEIFDRMLRSATICNGQSKLIACLLGEGIKLSSAFYGKRAGKDCHGELPYKDDSPTCSALDAKNKIQDACNGKQTCLLFADENVYGRSLCPNVNKYLHVDYFCFPRSVIDDMAAKRVKSTPMEDLEEDAVSRSTDPISQGKQNMTVQICNGERHAISCKRDVGMQIEKAFYGKIKGKDCRGDLGYRDDIPDCSNPRALDSVKFLCENRKSCELAAEKELFGDDVCPGVNKYLRVTYGC